jgi:Pyrimidine dimer DNA glycosylase
MRIWDVPPAELCRAHLLGEHRELHGIWAILTEAKAGYRNHPETMRWVGKQAALYERHRRLVEEMTARGYVHRSDLDPSLAVGKRTQIEFVDPVDLQRELLAAKSCPCYEAGQRVVRESS